MRALALRFVSIAFGLLLGLALAEAGVRLAVPDDWTEVRLPGADFERPSDLPEIPFLFRPNAGEWTNNLGLRNASDVSREKAPGVFRLLIVGDSVTALCTDAWSPYRLYPSILEKLLRESLGREVEVLNLSSPGLSMQQELALLRVRGLPLNPDLVLLAFARNDPIRTDIATAANVVFAGPFRLPRLLQLQHARFEMLSTHADWYTPGSRELRRLGRSFSELAEIAARQPLAVFPVPVRSTAAGEQTHIPAVQGLCRAYDLRCVDVATALAPYLSNVGPVRSGDLLHYDKAGHRALAEALVQPMSAMIRSVAQAGDFASHVAREIPTR